MLAPLIRVRFSPACRPCLFHVTSSPFSLAASICFGGRNALFCIQSTPQIPVYPMWLVKNTASFPLQALKIDLLFAPACPCNPYSRSLMTNQLLSQSNTQIFRSWRLSPTTRNSSVLPHPRHVKSSHCVYAQSAQHPLCSENLPKTATAAFQPPNADGPNPNQLTVSTSPVLLEAVLPIAKFLL